MNRRPRSSRKYRYTSRGGECVRGVDGAQHVDVDAGCVERVEPGLHTPERSSAALVHSGIGRAALLDRRSKAPPRSCARRRTTPSDRRPGRRWSGSCARWPDRVAGTARRAPSPGGRSRGPSSSARRPARRSSPPESDATPRAGRSRSPRSRRPSGTGLPGTAAPSTRRSSTRNRGCRSGRWAWPTRDTRRVPRASSSPHNPCAHPPWLHHEPQGWAPGEPDVLTFPG